ncbi:MAG: hypothetical protein PHD82_04815 [Candidatus Riflebacteria bacterium]|jgi:homoserine dehydrogenase|nr:hypothetical protein [Candidatus Riflebacteria bacterium]
MKSAGFINLPDWKHRLQDILAGLGQDALLKLPVLGRENAEKPWMALDSEDFFSAVQTGIHFTGSNSIKRLPENIVTTDTELAINRLLEGKHRQTFFSAAIGGTFPFQRLICSPYASAQPEKIIVQNDSVTSFILSRMEKEGKTLEEAVHEAQWEKLVGGNPSQNLHGLVTRSRLVLQIAQIFGQMVRPDQIKTLGINGLSVDDVRIASEIGYSIRLLGIAQFQAGVMRVLVEPCMIPSRYLLAQARGGSEMIYARATDGLTQVYACPGTSPEVQVRGLLSDLFEECRSNAGNLVPAERLESFSDHFYLRFNIVNITDTLAQLLQTFTRNDIEIEKIHQPAVAVSRETGCTAGFALVLVTSRVSRQILEKALDQISSQVKLASLKSCFRYIRQA